jgi:hypothetical protein
MIANRGYQALSCLIDQVHELLAPDHPLHAWYLRRWQELAGHLAQWAKMPDIDAFVNDYAASLVTDIVRLISAGDLEGVAEGLIEAGEDLARQAKVLAAARQPTAPAAEPFLPGIEPPPRKSAWALAA